METHKSGGLSECDICHKQFKQIATLRDHKLIHTGQKPHACVICQKLCRTAQDLRNHQNSHSGNDRTTNYNTKECPFCRKELKNKFELGKHMRKHTKENLYTCDLCSKSFRLKLSLKNHVVRHVTGTIRDYLCDLCQARLESLYSLKRHMRIHFDDKKCHCTLCPKMFRESGALKKHNLLHRKLNHMCTTYGKISKTESNRSKHVLKHSSAALQPGPSEYPCDYCEMKFKTSKSLKSHVREVHGQHGKHSYSCNICYKKFTT